MRHPGNVMGDLVRDGAGQFVAIQCGRQAPEKRDAKRPTQLGTRLPKSRRHAGPLGWDRPNDQVGRQGAYRCDAQSQENGSGHHDPEGVGSTDLGQHAEADCHDSQADCHCISRTNPKHEQRRKQGTDDEADARRQRPQASVQRSHPEHELQVLRNEEKACEGHEKAERVDGQRGAEVPRAEEPEVKKGVGQLVLAADEHGAQSQACQDGHRRPPSRAVLGELLDAVNDRQHGDQRQGRAEQVQPTRTGIAVFRQEPWPQREEQQHYRDGHQEHGAPPEVGEQCAADQRADRGTGREAGSPHPDGQGALLRVEEHVADQGQGGGRQGGRGDPEQCASRDQHLGASGEGGEDGAKAERGGTEQEEPAATDAVTQHPHGNQRSGQQEAVDVDNPE